MACRPEVVTDRHGLGIPPVAITPIWPLLLMAPAVIVIANAVAFWPGRATARLKPAEVLRAEQCDLGPARRAVDLLGAERAMPGATMQTAKGGVMGEPVRWSDDLDDVIRGDLTAAAAYVTPARGTVVTAVAPCGIGQRDLGLIGFTTSLGFGKKLERIIPDPRVALAFHAREHGFSANPAFLLAQGMASVDLRPSRGRLEALTPQAERYLGKVVRGPVWDRLLREYYAERVFVDIAIHRIAAWPDPSASGTMAVAGAPWPGLADPQPPPANGTGPRVDVAKAAGRIATLPHRVLAYRGADGFPVIVPLQIAGHDQAGLRLVVPAGLLPPGGRRAGLLAHAYRPQLVGLSTRIFTGWLQVNEDGVVYAPHTTKGFVAPPSKNLLLVLNGLLAKFGLWQARRHGTAERLERLAIEKAAAGTPG